jgi:hypothetical protein
MSAPRTCGSLFALRRPQETSSRPRGLCGKEIPLCRRRRGSSNTDRRRSKSRRLGPWSCCRAIGWPQARRQGRPPWQPPESRCGSRAHSSFRTKTCPGLFERWQCRPPDRIAILVPIRAGHAGNGDGDVGWRAGEGAVGHSRRHLPADRPAARSKSDETPSA